MLLPFNLATFVIGLSLLIAGAYYYRISDWDTGVSIIMASFTYLTAPTTITTIRAMNWRKAPHALFWTWFSVDGCYVIYHVTMGNVMLREAQWQTSLCLYLMCGVFWSTPWGKILANFSHRSGSSQ